MCDVVNGSVSQPFKGRGASDNKIVGKSLIPKLQFLASSIVDSKSLGSTSRLLAEHLWSPEQWLGTTGLGFHGTMAQVFRVSWDHGSNVDEGEIIFLFLFCTKPYSHRLKSALKKARSWTI